MIKTKKEQKNKIINHTIYILMILLFLTITTAQTTLIDSDGDGILDTHDKCPDTNPYEKPPINLRNPEYLGCSCSQIFTLMENQYCKEVYCMPERPLEIRNKAFSSRPSPCPPRRCEGTTQYSYYVDEIRCHQGKEMPYECEELITENAEYCLEQKETTQPIPEKETTNDIYDELIQTYLDREDFRNILNMKNKEELRNNNDELLKNIEINRDINITERTINNQKIKIAEIMITIKPKQNIKIEEFILIEQIKGDITNRNIIPNNEKLYDINTQTITWTLNKINEETKFTYRITPYTNLEHEYIIQGKTKSKIIEQIILPAIAILILILFTFIWIKKTKEKNNVFKN